MLAIRPYPLLHDGCLSPLDFVIGANPDGVDRGLLADYSQLPQPPPRMPFVVLEHGSMLTAGIVEDYVPHNRF